MIASIQGSLPQEVSANGVSQYIQAQEKELTEKQSKVNELLSHMNSLVTNNNDLAALQTLLQGSNQGLNLAANSAVSKYLDDYAKKLQKDNEERSANLQKTLLEALTNGDQYKYLREAGYGFRTDGEGISAYRQIHSGEIAIDGSAMKETSYSPELEYQYIRIETKFNPGNLSVDMMDPNTTRFNAEMVLGLKGYIDDLQKNVETMFAQFSDKTEEIKEEYVQNQEIESYQKKLYEASKENYVAAFQVLPGDLEKTFQQEMNGLKGYHEQGSKYNFNEGSFKDQSGDMKKVGKSMYDGANIEDTIFAGSRELKGSVSVKGIPVEISYGMQHLLVTSGFNISNLGFNFKLKGVGTNYVDNQLSGVNQKYSIYSEDISARIEKQAKANDEEKESKGFLFTILNGMNGGSGSMGQRFTQAVRSEAQSRITGAVAEATGLPASLVGALVGGSSMKDAVKAYVKDEATNAISKATGIPAWMISNQMEKMNKPKEQWYQSQEFQMVTTVVAVAAAPFTGGASLLVAMAVGAGIGAATGAASGGLKGALVGAVGGAAGAAVKSFTGGAVTVGLSYSAENGFGASVGVGYGPATVSVGISERGGTTVDLGLKSGAFNAGLSYNSKTRSVSGNAGLTTEGGTGFALSYNEGDGFGASISKSLDSGLNGGLSWSQKGGVGGNIGYEAPGDKNQPKNSLANQMKGAGGSLSFNQRDGVSASVSASGGVNAGNWSQSGGFQANTNFLADQWKADFVSKQGEIEELQSQGLSKEQATAILDARAQEESKAAQNKNNQETGKSVLDGYAISTQRREDGDGDSADPVDQRINQLKRELSEGISLADGNGTMSDAGGGSGLASAVKELSNKQAELNHLMASKEAGGITKSSSTGSESGGLLDGIKNLYGKTKELIYGPEAKPRSAYSDDRSAAQGTRIANETSAYLDYKEGKISKADYDKQMSAEKKAYYEATQGERNKIPMGSGYTDISQDNLGKLTHLEGIKGVTGRIVEKDGNVYFRTKADGMSSKSIPMEPTKITEKPFTKIDPHDQSKFPGAVDLHAPYGSPLTVMNADGNKFTVRSISSMSEGGNSLRLEYNLNGKTQKVDLRHTQNQFPSYVIDQLKAGKTPTFDTGTVVGWTGVTGQHGIGNDGKVKYDPTDHTHAQFQNSNATQWKDWGLKGMGF
ncbi:hypothetical protein BWD13_19825 [Leptospira santarosai serovar Grippotyphosa]|nr:hypothetical protein BWD13_19825 [Leptospira santarosai serovar Grippotyphosa]